MPPVFYTMWETVLASGKQATRLTRNVHLVTFIRTRPATRAFSAIPHHQKHADQAEDINREALDPQRTEVTQSGTDSDIAQHDSAWDPSNTAPESEFKATEQEHNNKGEEGTLSMSPANPDIRAWQNQMERDSERGDEQRATSQRGQPNKNRTIHVKEDGTHVSRR